MMPGKWAIIWVFRELLILVCLQLIRIWANIYDSYNVLILFCFGREVFEDEYFKRSHWFCPDKQFQLKTRDEYYCK